MGFPHVQNYKYRLGQNENAGIKDIKAYKQVSKKPLCYLLIETYRNINEFYFCSREQLVH